MKNSKLWSAIKEHKIAVLIGSVSIYILSQLTGGFLDAAGGALFVKSSDYSFNSGLVGITGCSPLNSTKLRVYSTNEDGLASNYRTTGFRTNNKTSVQFVGNSKKPLKSVVLAVKAVGKGSLDDLVLATHLHSSDLSAEESRIVVSTVKGTTTIEIPIVHKGDSFILHKYLSRPADLRVQFKSENGTDNWTIPRGTCHDINYSKELNGSVIDIFTSPECDTKLREDNVMIEDCPLYIGDNAQKLVEHIRKEYPNSNVVEFFRNGKRYKGIKFGNQPVPDASNKAHFFDNI